MATDSAKAPLSERELALLAFVLKAVDHRATADAADIARLKEFGWLESDIIDAANLGVGMLVHGRLLSFFQMAE